MHQVNMHEAKTHLSKLVEEVQSGEEVVIAKFGKPVARIVSYDKRSEPRTPGKLRGQIWVSDDFDDASQEIVGMFEGTK
ncbi:MAG: type II toxin-antitoxin system Phd/YefM family antitoxin [Sedimenticola sp.]